MVWFGEAICGGQLTRWRKITHECRPCRDEYLAPLIGVNGTSALLINYAYSGATIDNVRTIREVLEWRGTDQFIWQQSLQSATVPDTKTQIESFMSDIKTGIFPPPSSGTDKTLVVIWAGVYTSLPPLNKCILAHEAHSYIPGINPLVDLYKASITNSNVSAASTSALSKINSTTSALFTQILDLRNFLSSNPTTAGAKFDFLVLPVPPLQFMPLASVLSLGTTTPFFGLWKVMSTAFNLNLRAGMSQGQGGTNGTSGVVLEYLDVPAWLAGIAANPEAVRPVFHCATWFG